MTLTHGRSRGPAPRRDFANVTVTLPVSRHALRVLSTRRRNYDGDNNGNDLSTYRRLTIKRQCEYILILVILRALETKRIKKAISRR